MENKNNYDNFLRVFNKVKQSKKFTAYGKLIFSDILSFQLEGKEYKKMDKTIGYDLGITEGRAHKEVKKIKASGEIDTHHEYVQKQSGERPTKVRTLSVKDPNKWTSKASEGNSENNSEPNAKGKPKGATKSSIYNSKENRMSSHNDTSIDSNKDSSSAISRLDGFCDSISRIYEFEKDDESEPTVSEFTITQEKLNWLNKNIQKERDELTSKDLESFQTGDLIFMFYGEDSLWNVNDSIIENIHQIRKIQNGGSRCTIQNQNNCNDSFCVNIDEFENYLYSEGVQFADIDAYKYRLLKSKFEASMVFN